MTGIDVLGHLEEGLENACIDRRLYLESLIQFVLLFILP